MLWNFIELWCDGYFVLYQPNPKFLLISGYIYLVVGIWVVCVCIFLSAIGSNVADVSVCAELVV